MSRDESPTETDEHTPDTPSLSDRIDESEDFTAALEQSVGIVKDHRKLLLVLVLASLALGLWLVYPSLLDLIA